MTCPAAVATALLALVGHTHVKAAPSKALPPLPLPRVWVRPPSPLPMLPSVARVRLEVSRDRVVVHEDVALPRGDWVSGGLDFHVAFGAPGTPVAVDAQIGAAPAAGSESHAEEPAEPVTVEPAPGAVGGARSLLGRPRMAGVILRVKEAQLRHAYASSDAAALRVRSLLALPPADPNGRRDVVVRLGAPEGTPLSIGRIQVVSLDPAPWITRVEATLCGPDADPWPLSVSLTPRPQVPVATFPRPIAPAMAVRHPADDLCIRWWSSN